METTATLLPNGGFDLHTPSERAAKYAILQPKIIRVNAGSQIHAAYFASPPGLPLRIHCLCADHRLWGGSWDQTVCLPAS